MTEHQPELPIPTAAHVGFFAVLRGTFTGTEIFFRLRRHSLWRTLLHLGLISFLLAVLATFIIGNRLRPELNAFKEAVVREFGDALLVSPDGIRPQRNPERARTIELPFRSRLIYVPDFSKGINIDAGELAGMEAFALWTPRFLLAARGNPGGETWQTYTATPPAGSSEKVLSTPELVDFLRAGQAPTGEWPVRKTETLPIEPQFAAIPPAIGIVFFIMEFFGVILYTLLFAAMSKLLSFGRPQALSFAEFWRVGIYAAFPVMAVTAAFPLFALPLSRYSSLFFVFGLIVYWMAIAGRLERTLAGNQEENSQ